MNQHKPRRASLISRLTGYVSPEHSDESLESTEFAQRIAYLARLVHAGVLPLDFESILRTQYQKWIRPGDTVFDVGAHTGKHLQSFIELVGPSGTVVAFEPIPFAHYHINTTYAAPNVTVHNVALSEETGKAAFTYARGTPEESGLMQKTYNFPDLANPETIEVTVGRLDDYLHDINSLRFLKIDIEGGEIGCLKAATKIFNELRPVMSVEYGFPGYSAYGHTKDTLFDMASQHRYILYDLFGNRLADRRTWQIACDSIYWDYFMVPSEVESEFAKTLMLKPSR